MTAINCCIRWRRLADCNCLAVRSHARNEASSAAFYQQAADARGFRERPMNSRTRVTAEQDGLLELDVVM
jgi:hypothetical protein